MDTSATQHAIPPFELKPAKGFASLKVKLLAIIAGILVGMTIVNVLLASYLIKKQNEEEAYRRLTLQLNVFQKDMEALHANFEHTVMETIKAEKTLQNLALVYSQQLSGNSSASFAKIVCLNQLQLMILSGAIDGAAVYLENRLSHYITAEQAGLWVIPAGGQYLVNSLDMLTFDQITDPKGQMLSTREKRDGQFDVRHWRAWQTEPLPEVFEERIELPAAPQHRMFFLADRVIYQLIIPMQAVLTVRQQSVVPEDVTPASKESQQDASRIVGGFVFVKILDRRLLEAQTEKTDVFPSIHAPDGSTHLHVQEFRGIAKRIRDFQASEGAGGAPECFGTLTTLSGMPYYHILRVWQAQTEYPFVLGAALSQASTLATIRTTQWWLIAVAMGMLGIIFLAEVLLIDRFMLKAARDAADETWQAAQDANAAALEAKRVAEAAQKASEAAQKASEAANQAKSEFLATMSHELRTPLNGIIGYTQILQRNSTLDASQREAVDIIHRSGHHLLLMINDILDLAKIEARKLELCPTHFSFPNFMNDIADIIRMRAQEKGLMFQYLPLSPLPVKVFTDEKRLRQILLNLLGNAVKFTDAGQVTLRVRDLGKQQDADFVSQFPNTFYLHHLRFEVEDTGIGISPAQIQTIFLPFEQAGDRQYRACGVGLGLAISRQFVQLMGSDIQVRSEQGKGSTFQFELLMPVMIAPLEAREDRTRYLVGYTGRKQLALIVDDDAVTRSFLSDLLMPLGFEVCVAQNGQEALEKTREFQPDVLLIDLVMPVMDGFEAVQKIRQLPSSTELVIIAVSARVYEADRIKSRMAGCDGFVAKPVDAWELFAVLEQLIDVEWIYANEDTGGTETSPKPATPGSSSLISPSREELQHLHTLALKGDMFSIQKYMNTLHHADAALRPFAEKILRFAEHYQDEALVNFLEDYLNNS